MLHFTTSTNMESLKNIRVYTHTHTHTHCRPFKTKTLYKLVQRQTGYKQVGLCENLKNCPMYVSLHIPKESIPQVCQTATSFSNQVCNTTRPINELIATHTHEVGKIATLTQYVSHYLTSISSPTKESKRVTITKIWGV